MAEAEAPEEEAAEEEDVLLEIRPSRRLFVYSYIGALVFLILGILNLTGFYTVPEAVPLKFIDLNLFLQVFCLVSVFILLISPEIRRMAVKYTITDTDVWEDFGYFNKRSINLPLVKMERCDLKRSMTERALNIGDVKVDTGEDYFFLEGLPEPTKIRKLIVERMERVTRGGSSPAVHQ